MAVIHPDLNSVRLGPLLEFFLEYLTRLFRSGWPIDIGIASRVKSTFGYEPHPRRIDTRPPDLSCPLIDEKSQYGLTVETKRNDMGDAVVEVCVGIPLDPFPVVILL